ncbi:hypothetical protein D3C79_840670 [compost metagenome]
MDLVSFVTDETSNSLGIQQIGLATLTQAPEVTGNLPRVEHIDTVARRMSQLGQGQMVGTGRLHTDPTACWQLLEPATNGGTPIGEVHHRLQAIGRRHQLVLTDVHPNLLQYLVHAGRPRYPEIHCRGRGGVS